MSFRVVADTNVVISSQRSNSPSSPSRELLGRWTAGEFDLLYTLDVLVEYIRKLRELGIDSDAIQALLIDFAVLAELVTVSSFHEPIYPSDPDDIAFLLCATNGSASHLVTYDSHFDRIRSRYEFCVCAPLEFLQELRCSLDTV